MQRQMKQSRKYSSVAHFVNAAGNVLTPTIRSQYKALFVGLGSNLSSVVGTLGTLKSINFGGTFAYILVTRTVADGQDGYFIYLIRDGDGIWRIDGM